MRDLKAKAKAFSQGPGGRRLNMQALEIELDEARREIRFAVPYAICPYCQATDPDCKGCDGLGWVGEDTFDQAPKAAVAAG